MTHFCTTIHRQTDFEICLKIPIKEIIFEHQSLSRLGELDTATILEMLERWKKVGRIALLQWDLLHDEKSFQEAIGVLKELPLEKFFAIRVQDLGAANWLRKHHSNLKLQWIVEGSNHNLKGLLRWSEFLKPQLDRLVLSSEIPESVLKRCFTELPQGCEILGIGRVLLFYSPRHLLSSLNETNEKSPGMLSVSVSTEETPQRKLATIESKHGTFLFYDRDLFLLEHFSRLNDFGLQAFRLDLRHVGMQWLPSIINTDPEDKASITKLKKEWPSKTFQGFFRANRTDKALKRMKNPFRQAGSSRPVAEVLEASKNHHLALLIKQSIRSGVQLWGVTPEGRILELKSNQLTDIQYNHLEAAEPDQVVLIPHEKYAVPKTLVYSVKPNFD